MLLRLEKGGEESDFEGEESMAIYQLHLQVPISEIGDADSPILSDSSRESDMMMLLQGFLLGCKGLE